MAPLDATITQALSAYESTHSLPRGWLIYALTHASPSTSLSSLTHSSLTTALHSADLWTSFRTSPSAPLSLAARTNRTLIGDPVSLKAETADSNPTSQDRGSSSGASTTTTTFPLPPPIESTPQSGAEMREKPQRGGGADEEEAPKKIGWGAPPPPPNDPPSGTKMQQKSLKQVAKENVTQLGDPVSLKAETADSNPTPEDRGAGGEARVTETPEETREGGSGGVGTAVGKDLEGPPGVDVDEVWSVVEKARGGKGNRAKM